MPAKSTVGRTEEDLHEGKSATTAAGEFVHEEIEACAAGQARCKVAAAGDRNRAEQSPTR